MQRRGEIVALYKEWTRRRSRHSETAARMTGKYILADLVDLGGTLHDYRLLYIGRLIESCWLCLTDMGCSGRV